MAAMAAYSRACASTLVSLLALALPAINGLALTPPMGFMTWQLFRCNGPGAAGPGDDCSDPNTTYCISSALIEGQSAAMKKGGFVAAGYNIVSIDDCWMSGRNATTHEFIAWPQAFPSGTLAPTAAFVHGLGMQLGTYTAESRGTCCGHEASQGFEEIDANTFAAWGVDYLCVVRHAPAPACSPAPPFSQLFTLPHSPLWLCSVQQGGWLQQQCVLLRGGLPADGRGAGALWPRHCVQLLVARLHYV